MSKISERPRIFITGITGYIGGDAYHAIIQKHPAWEGSTSCLVRTEAKGQQVLARYPSIRLVHGELDDVTLIEDEASQADIVLHFASIDHVSSAQAISRAIAAREQRNQTTYWISVSGTDNIAWKDCDNKTYGEEPSDIIYDDYEGLDKVTSLPESALHQDVERIQLAAGGSSVKTAIVCAPCIYGVGRGCVNQRSIQIPDLARYTLQKGYCLQVGKGRSIWPNVHVADLSDIFLRLVDAAVQNGDASWNQEGYYFAESGEHVWGDVSAILAEEAKRRGWIQSAEVRSFDADTADTQIEFASIFYGASSRCRATRARRLLGWEHRQTDIRAASVEALEVEAKALDV